MNLNQSWNIKNDSNTWKSAKLTTIIKTVALKAVF